MAGLFDAFTNIHHGYLASPSGSHTAAGSNLYALMGTSSLSGQVCSAVTYDGVNAVELAAEHSAGKVRTSLWGLAGIPSGAKTVAATFASTAGTRTFVVWTFSGIAQTDSVFASGSTGGGYDTGSSITLNSDTTCVGAAIDSFWGTIVGSYDWLSAGSPSSAGYHKQGEVTNTTFTFTYGGTDRWSNSAAMLKPFVSTFTPRGSMWFSKIQDFYDELKRGMIPPAAIRKRYEELYI